MPSKISNAWCALTAITVSAVIASHLFSDRPTALNTCSNTVDNAQEPLCDNQPPKPHEPELQYENYATFWIGDDDDNIIAIFAGDGRYAIDWTAVQRVAATHPGPHDGTGLMARTMLDIRQDALEQEHGK